MKLWYFVVKTKPVTLIGKSTKRADGTIPTSSRSSVTHNMESTQQRFASINTPRHWHILLTDHFPSAWPLKGRDSSHSLALPSELLCSSDSSWCHQPWLCLLLGALARQLSPALLDMTLAKFCCGPHLPTFEHLVTSTYRPPWPTVGVLASFTME